MKRAFRISGLLSVLATIFLSGCYVWEYPEKEIMLTVLDADTGKPMADALVVQEFDRSRDLVMWAMGASRWGSTTLEKKTKIVRVRPDERLRCERTEGVRVFIGPFWTETSTTSRYSVWADGYLCGWVLRSDMLDKKSVVISLKPQDVHDFHSCSGLYTNAEHILKYVLPHLPKDAPNRRQLLMMMAGGLRRLLAAEPVETDLGPAPSDVHKRYARKHLEKIEAALSESCNVLVDP